MKTLLKKPAAHAGAGALGIVLGIAILAMACNIPSAPDQDAAAEDAAAQNVDGTGKILISFDVEGADALKPAGSRNLGSLVRGLVRTVVPSGFGLGSFSKFEAAFTATSGGQTHGPVVVSGGTNEISLEAGTYTVTITAYTGTDPSFTASAEGSVAGIVVTAGGSTPASVLLGPKSGAGNGTFSYDITVVPAITSGSLNVVPAGGGAAGGGSVNLPGNGAETASTMSLAGGYYQALVSLTKGAEGAGLVEIVHIYPGLTSALPAQTFTDDDFAQLVTVSDFALTGTFAAPVTGQAAAGSLNAAQYTGTISWNPAHTTFAASTPYTATVTLTAKPGYTFAGIAPNAFSYSGASTVSNSADSGVVTIAFPATGTGNAGQASASYSVDDEIIAVTADPAGKTITAGGETDLVLTVPAGYTVSGWYVDGTLITALGTNNSVTLDADDYSAKTYRVSVIAGKGGRPYSWSDSFVVEAAGGGGPVLLGLTEFIAAAQAVEANTPETAVTLALDPSVDVTDTSTLTSLETVLNELTGYIVVDLSAYTFTTMTGTNQSPGFNSTFLSPEIVGIILPDSLETLGNVMLYDPMENGGLRSITIPAGVTEIKSNALGGNKNLTSITILGAGVNLTNSSFSPYGTALKTAYDNNGAGTYVLNSTTWSKAD
jgi:hypothetical protein